MPSRTTVGRPRVERPDAGEDPEADVERQEDPLLQRGAERHRLQRHERERVGSARDIQRENADEDERRPEEQVQRQLHRGVFLRADAGPPHRPAEDPLRLDVPRRSPDADEQVHRQHGDLVEEEEDEQIQRDEHAVDARDQQEEQRVELLPALLHRPRREHAREDDDRREQRKQRAHPVDAQQVRDPQRRDQLHLLAELESGRGAVVLHVDHERRDQRHGRADERGPPHEQRPAPREEHDDERAHERRPGHHGENRQSGHRNGFTAASTPRESGCPRRRRRRSPARARSESAAADRRPTASTRSSR